MPTHDYIIANGTGAAVRADINLALSAIVSLNSSASEPATMYAYQLWADTALGLLKIRNSGNSAWITLRQLDGDFSIVAVEDGLLATPSLTFTTDLNTGIFRPSTDSLGIVTGGQYAIACTSTQAVGIRTANPSAALHVAGVARIGADDTTDAVLEIGAGATGNRESYIDLVGDTTYNDYGARFGRSAGANGITYFAHRGTGAISIQTTEAGPITFSTTNTERLRLSGSGDFVFKGAGTTPGTDKAVFFSTAAPINSMVLDSSGLLGIGTSAPTSTLHIQHAAQTTGYWEGKGLLIHEDATANQGIAFFSRGSNEQYIASLTDDAASYLIIGTRKSSSTNNVDALTIRGDGKVGIGTTGPAGELDVRGPNSGNLYVGRKNNSGAASEPGNINFSGPNASGNARVWGRINSIIDTATEGSEAANLTFLLQKAGGLSEVARLDGSGRLLVGTTSLRTTGWTTQVGGEIFQEMLNYGGITSFVNLNDVDGTTITLGKSRGTAVGSNTIVQNNDKLGLINFQGTDGSAPRSAAYIFAQVDGTVGANRMPGRLVFSTATDASPSVLTERMRINSTGRTDTFCTADNCFLVKSSAGAGTTYYTFASYHSATGTNAGGTTSFAVFTNGDVANTNNSYGTISDLKLKENIVDANSQWDDLKALQVRNYNLKEGQTHTQIGLVAQEVELVSPGLVYEFPDRDEDGNDLGTVTKGVHSSVLYMKAVKALQEAMERIEQLETSNTDLLARVIALETA